MTSCKQFSAISQVLGGYQGEGQGGGQEKGCLSDVYYEDPISRVLQTVPFTCKGFLIEYFTFADKFFIPLFISSH